MMSSVENDESGWNSRYIYLKVLLCQTIGANAFIELPNLAITHGATGHIIIYVIVYITLGIPLLYMEFVVSQFTGRDCLQVWKARPCLSHIGYIHIFRQLIMVIYNHAMTAFITHYFLISFEDPIPYYVCGHWTTKDCNIVTYNYTVNQDCMKVKEQFSYCQNLYMTFPECQYWKNYILGVTARNFHIAWRVCLASGLCCVFLFLSCFKRKRSVQWCLGILAIYPLAGYTILLIGSMVQRGLVVMYEEALDSDFSVFSEKYRISKIIMNVIHALNIGTGISFNLAASTSFRSPCYSNVVITVVICTIFTVLAVCTVAMMVCPYSYEHGIRPYNILNYPISLVFEKTTRLFYEYENKTFWLVLILSCNAVLGLGTNVIIILNLLEIMMARNPRVAEYPALITFVGVFILFLITIPLLGYRGISLLVNFRRLFNFTAVFFAVVECVVFVLWYGVDKFSEDVHFMQGIEPKNYMKIAWIGTCVVLPYVFCAELYYKFMLGLTFGEKLGCWALAAVSLGTILIVIVKLSVAAAKRAFQEAVRLDPSWGPRSDVLLRSRAMFTAQAMTKEYLYRQYHLQAGIIARQRKSNARTHRDV